MHGLPRLVVIGVVAMSACSVKPVSYTPLGDPSAPPDTPPPAPPDTPPPPPPPAARCGDGTVDPGEEVDPPTSPSKVVTADAATCRYDFSAITQLFCAGSCGSWDGMDGCSQGDADALCRLRTGDPARTAASFKLAFAADAPGICCPIDVAQTGCISLGMFPDRGVDQLVAIDDTSLQASHGSGAVVTDVVCAP